MGVVNVTPDSFSDGGDHATVDAAVAHGQALLADGADLLDIGGESTRPGAGRVPVEEELRRVVPVVQRLVAAGATVSVDTVRAAVARAALDVGAALVNDVSAGRGDDAMLALVAGAGVPYVVMHGRGESADMQSRATYGDVVGEVVAELRARVDAAVQAGVGREQLVVDPGLGFAKTAAHNWALLAALPALDALGCPVLVGASRKAFLGALLGSADAPRPPKERDAATAALTVLAAQAGAWAVRVHDVRPSADAVRVVAAVRSAGQQAAR
jgi:dihydropteroate synthase